jgi:agmatinase
VTSKNQKVADLHYLKGEDSFLDPARLDADTPDKAGVVVIPFGLEASVSYGGGTHKGPQAILEASHQLELFDEELWREPYRDFGVAAIHEPKIPKSVEKALDVLDQHVDAVLDLGKMPFILGGEHSLTAGAIRPFARRHKDLVVLHFDAHADLRDGYQGEHYSHAAAMRRVLDHQNVSLVSVGLRAFSAPEAEFMDANPERIFVHLGVDQARWDIEAIVRPLLGKSVYVTYDIDALDGAIMPATGTPTPGGMSYLQSLAILRRACEVSTIVGMDLVEFAPIKHFHAYDFLAAQLAAKMMYYARSGTRRR